jgi:two-component sensor histidine kinase
VAPELISDSVGLNLALALVATSTAPLILLDKDLVIIAASASFCTAFQVDPVQTRGFRLPDLGAGEWNMAQLTSLLKATASGYAAIDGYEMDLMRKGQLPRKLILNAAKLQHSEDAETRVALSISDVTDARLAAKLKDDLLRDKEVLLQELHHRVANSLQIIASVLLQSARAVQSEEIKQHLHDAHHRVMSVASLQQQLASSKRGDVELRPYFKALCESIGASMIRDHNQISLDVTSDDSVTSADISVSMGLIVTELVINALKHAFPGDRSGKILVNYRSHGAGWTLSVGDDGIGMPNEPSGVKGGLGTSIVQALATQLGGQVSVANTKPGTKVSIVHAYVPVLTSQWAERAT